MDKAFVVQVYGADNESFEILGGYETTNLFVVTDIEDAIKWVSDESTVLNWLLEHDDYLDYCCGCDSINDAKNIKYTFKLFHKNPIDVNSEESPMNVHSEIVIEEYYDSSVEQFEDACYTSGFTHFIFGFEELSIMNGGDINETR